MGPIIGFKSVVRSSSFTYEEAHEEAKADPPVPKSIIFYGIYTSLTTIHIRLQLYRRYNCQRVELRSLAYSNIKYVTTDLNPMMGPM